MISAAQIREARTLLGWTPLTLAIRAFLALDDVTKALDDVQQQNLGGLQLGAICEAFEITGVELSSEIRDGSVWLWEPASA